MRMEFTLDGLDARRFERAFAAEVGRAASAMDWRSADAARAAARRDPRLARGPLPARPALALAARRAATPRSCSSISNHPDHAADVEGFGVPLPPRAGRQGEQAGGRGAHARAARRPLRPRRARALHADPLAATSSTRVGAPVINIHHSFLPAFAGARPLPARARARREDHRRDRALRHRGARRGPDHRAGRRARHPPRRASTRSSASAATSSAPCSPARWAAPRGPRARPREPDRGLLGGWCFSGGGVRPSSNA